MENVRLFDSLFCAIDFETTGGNYTKDKIIEIGAVKIKNLKIVDKFHHIINPLIKVPYRIAQITGITNDTVQGEPTISEVASDFLDFIRNSIWIEHSTNWFDFNFFVNSFDFKDRVLRINTLEIARKFLMLKKYDLTNVASELGVNLSQYPRDKHNAIEDAIITAEIFIKLYPILKKNGIETINHIMEVGLLYEYKS